MNLRGGKEGKEICLERVGEVEEVEEGEEVYEMTI